MQFKPPSQPGWNQSEPGPQEQFPAWQQQPSMHTPVPPAYTRPENYYPPQQPAPQPPLLHKEVNRATMFLLVGVIGCLIVVGAGFLSRFIGNSSIPQFSSGQSTSSSVSSSQNGIGSSQQSGPWSVTVNDIKTSQGDQAFTPKAGNTYVIIGVTLKNTSDTTQMANEAVLFALRDDQGNQYQFTALLDDQVLLGSVVAGQQLRGHLVYEVPKSITSFVLQCEADFDPTTVVQWNLSL